MSYFPCYVHIEKCAGTTLHHCLIYHLPGYTVLRPWHYWSNDSASALSAGELKALLKISPSVTGIGGHTTRTYLDYESVVSKPVRYFTFLRNPIERYISHYNHQTNKMGIRWRLEDFLSERRFSNFITRRLAGDENLEVAIERLESRFSFVGNTDRFNESLMMLRQFVFNNEISLFYENRNETSSTSSIRINDIEDHLKSRIEEENKLDVQLYRYFMDKVYPEQVARYDGDLVRDVETFFIKNEAFNYRKGKYFLSKLKKVTSDKVLQPIAHKRLNHS